MSDVGCEKEDEDKLTERWAEWAEWNQTEWTGRKKKQNSQVKGAAARRWMHRLMWMAAVSMAALGGRTFECS